MTLDDLAVAQRLADVTDRITRAAYRAGRSLPHRIKGDGSPVTDHDREVEEALRDELRRLRPDDGFVGEEVGAHGHAERRWVVDGIDGTGNFMVGDPRWSTQIALMRRGSPIVGVSTSPAQQRRWWATTTTPARTAPVSAAGVGAPTTMRVSRVGRLDPREGDVHPATEAPRSRAARHVHAGARCRAVRRTDDPWREDGRRRRCRCVPTAPR
jgi:histidinol-phosphatase